MKRFVFALSLVLPLLAGQSGPAAALWMPGNRLVNYCLSSAIDAQLSCAAYVIGVADMISLGHAHDDSRYDVVCFPDVTTVSTGQLMRIVVNYLEKHPEKEHMVGAILVVEAFAEAFPCQQ